jgi:hypothetical protein
MEHVYVVIDLDETQPRREFEGKVKIASNVFANKEDALTYLLEIAELEKDDIPRRKLEQLNTSDKLFIAENHHNILIKKVPIHTSEHEGTADLLEEIKLQHYMTSADNNNNNNNNNNYISPIPRQNDNERHLRRLRNMGIRIVSYGGEMNIPRGSENVVMMDINDGDYIVDTKRNNGEWDSKFNVYHLFDSFTSYRTDNASGLPKHPLTREPIREVKLYKAKIENTIGGRRRKTMKKRSSRK